MRYKGYHYFYSAEFMTVATSVVWFSLVFVNQAKAFSADFQHSFLSGPWELVIKMGFEGEGLRFPLKISDENKPQNLDAILPVIKTPIKVRLEEYVPDLRWETIAVKYPGEGIVAKLNIKGGDFERDLWLSTANLSKQSISSGIGGIGIRRLYDPDRIEKIVKELANPKAIGTISVWPEDSNLPYEYVAKVAETTTIPKSKYKLTVLDYLPHYSIDKTTKKVVNLSNEPVNPAVRVSINNGRQTIEQWLWAKFLSSPHPEENNFPLRMQFTDFDLGQEEGKYILITARGQSPWLFFSEKGGKKAEKAVIGRSYPFASKDYSFRIDAIIDGSILKTQWKNNSEKLINPAVIATIEHEGIENQEVLELDKPIHYKTKYGTLVLLYRRRPMS
jgi:hypothetical protein